MTNMAKFQLVLALLKIITLVILLIHPSSPIGQRKRVT